MKDPRPDAIRRLAEAGVDNPRLDVRLLWDHSQRNPGIFQSFIKRRIAREPLAYITGYKEFWSLEFEVGPGILVPRPATETLVEQVLDAFPGVGDPLTILDLGTGSGCLLISLLKEFPNARGLGVDSSPKALDVAGRNLTRHGLDNRATLTSGNWLDNLEGHWSVIVSNPPYIPTADIAGLEPDVRDYEPMSALDGGPDGLDAVRVLAKTMRGRGRMAFVEIGIGQGEAAASIFTAAGHTVLRVAADLAGIPRILVARLAA